MDVKPISDAPPEAYVRAINFSFLNISIALKQGIYEHVHTFFSIQFDCLPLVAFVEMNGMFSFCKVKLQYA